MIRLCHCYQEATRRRGGYLNLCWEMNSILNGLISMKREMATTRMDVIARRLDQGVTPENRKKEKQEMTLRTWAVANRKAADREVSGNF